MTTHASVEPTGKLFLSFAVFLVILALFGVAILAAVEQPPEVTAAQSDHSDQIDGFLRDSAREERLVAPLWRK